MPPKSKKKIAPKFDDQLVLAQWLLGLLEVSSWDALPLAELKEAEKRLWSETSPFADVLNHELFERRRLGKGEILRIDAQIQAITERMNEKRGLEPVRWKYFQWLALLLTAVYLERLFADREEVRGQLNALTPNFALPPYAIDPETGADDLDKIAFWMATGSGKTLLLHAHYQLYKQALERHGRPKPRHVLLVTPSKGLANQHVRELRLSGLTGSLFSKDGLSSRMQDFTVIEITRIGDRAGVETIGVDYFTGDNLVFVDEGHRGSTSEDGKWRERRKKLVGGGFCFEYSATLSQAAAKSAAMHADYARSIAFNYAYSKFYSDGYGKHWRILNLKKEPEDRPRFTYLCGALLALFQQLWVYDQNASLAAEFGIARPLCILVGASVVGGKDKESDAEQTDIETVLEFLARFIKDRTGAEKVLGDILNGRSGMLTRNDEDVFSGLFTQLPLSDWPANRLYDEILRRVFGTTSTGLLHVKELKDAPGELALSVGDNPAFGVINVGDVVGVRKKCELPKNAESIFVDTKAISGSLFDRIDDVRSPLTILVGSRKFSEGWSSWRVSLMGLLNLGNAKGTQIIQLFGRGVRLRGKDMSLKRSEGIAECSPKDRKTLKVLETLGIFGIRANYMTEFEKELKDAGIEDGDANPPLVETIPVIRTTPLPKRIVLMPPKMAFVESGEIVAVTGTETLDGSRIVIDAYPRVQARTDRNSQSLAIAAHKAYAGAQDCFAFIDHQRIYAELIELKNTRKWRNLHLPRFVRVHGDDQHLAAVIVDRKKYEIFIPDRDMDVSQLDDAHLALWNGLASDICRAYVHDCYVQQARTWTEKNLRIEWLDHLTQDDLDRLFPTEYTITIGQKDAQVADDIVQFIRGIKKLIEGGNFDHKHALYLATAASKVHLYQPLAFYDGVDPQKMKVSISGNPALLNGEEQQFAQDLQRYVDSKPMLLNGAEVHLLRNEALRGVAFGGLSRFFPDFMLWIKKDGRQWLTFVDPKGLMHIHTTEGDAKLNLWKRLHELEQRPDLQRDNVLLDSWIVSTTDLGVMAGGESAWFAQHVVFPNAGYVARMIGAILGRTGTADAPLARVPML